MPFSRKGILPALFIVSISACGLSPTVLPETALGASIRASSELQELVGASGATLQIAVLPEHEYDAAMIENGGDFAPVFRAADFEDLVDAGRAAFLELELTAEHIDGEAAILELDPGEYHVQATLFPRVESLATFSYSVWAASTYFDVSGAPGSLLDHEPAAISVDSQRTNRTELTLQPADSLFASSRVDVFDPLTSLEGWTVIESDADAQWTVNDGNLSHRGANPAQTEVIEYDLYEDSGELEAWRFSHFSRRVDTTFGATAARLVLWFEDGSRIRTGMNALTEYNLRLYDASEELVYNEIFDPHFGINSFLNTPMAIEYYDDTKTIVLYSGPDETDVLDVSEFAVDLSRIAAVHLVGRDDRIWMKDLEYTLIPRRTF